MAVARTRLAEAIEPCRSTLRRTTLIALCVGCVLTLINEGDILVRRDFSPLLAVKIGLNLLVPFVVSNLGVLAATRTARD